MGATAEVKAEKGFYLDGDATFAFESKNPELFTVTANGGVATIKGVAKGQGKLAITMTLAGKTYTAERAITVSQPSTEPKNALKVNNGKYKALEEKIDALADRTTAPPSENGD